RARPLTVHVIDHSSMAQSASTEHVAGYSAAKAAAVDVVYYQDKTRDFDVFTEGVVELIVKDDRKGRLPNKHRRYRVGGQGPDAKHLRFKEDTTLGFTRTKTEVAAVAAAW